MFEIVFVCFVNLFCHLHAMFVEFVVCGVFGLFVFVICLFVCLSVCPCVCLLPLHGLTTEQISTKIGREVPESLIKDALYFYDLPGFVRVQIGLQLILNGFECGFYHLIAYFLRKV